MTSTAGSEGHCRRRRGRVPVSEEIRFAPFSWRDESVKCDVTKLLQSRREPDHAPSLCPALTCARVPQMARYIQKLSLLGRERWIGWEIDGIGTEVPGLVLAEDLSDEDLRAHGVMDFSPMPFKSFLGLGAALTKANGSMLDEDLEFRLDALQVGMDRSRSRGLTI